MIWWVQRKHYKTLLMRDMMKLKSGCGKSRNPGARTSAKFCATVLKNTRASVTSMIFTRFKKMTFFIS